MANPTDETPRLLTDQELAASDSLATFQDWINEQTPLLGHGQPTRDQLFEITYGWQYIDPITQQLWECWRAAYRDGFEDGYDKGGEAASLDD